VSNWRRSFTAAAAFFTWSTVIRPGMAAAVLQRNLRPETSRSFISLESGW
jgi:hypothetical protein